MFGNQRELSVPDLKQRAVDLKLDTAAFNQCLDSGRYVSAIQSDIDEGVRNGVSGTPTLFINGRLLSGNRLRIAERPCDCTCNCIQSQHSKELTMAIDPVCGMEVDERTTKEKATHQGATYYFCSADCRQEFQTSPEDYIGGEEEMTGT